MKKGTVVIVDNFFMPEMNRHRTLRIYLPPEYDELDKRYPVLYMHDAQNLFDVNTSSFGSIWDIATIMDEYYNNYSLGLIIVGIDNGKEYRYEEYSPWKDTQIQEIMPHVRVTNRPGGKGILYSDFIVNTLKPYIDTHYRTLTDRENTAISGSSMGGLISLAIGIRHQDIFSKVAAFSSALFFAEQNMVEFIHTTGKHDSMKIYMDIGTKETSNNNVKEFPEIYINSNKRIYKKLREIGFTEEEIYLIIVEGAIHNEKEWSKRFPNMIRWLYNL